MSTTEIRYYKADKADGPVYVTSKADVTQIVYANSSKDVFNTQVNKNKSLTTNNYSSRYRRAYSRPFLYPIITPHIDLGHHGYFEGHHGGGHYGGHH